MEARPRQAQGKRPAVEVLLRGAAEDGEGGRKVSEALQEHVLAQPGEPVGHVGEGLHLLESVSKLASS